MDNNALGTLKLYNVAVHTKVHPISCAVTKFRDRCSVIRNYPLHRVDILSDLVHVFAEGSPLYVRLYYVLYCGASY